MILKICLRIAASRMSKVLQIEDCADSLKTIKVLKRFFFIVLRQDLSTAIKDPLLDLTTLNDVVEEESSSIPSNSKINNIAHQNMIRR